MSLMCNSDPNPKWDGVSGAHLQSKHSPAGDRAEINMTTLLVGLTAKVILGPAQHRWQLDRWRCLIQPTASTIQFIHGRDWSGESEPTRAPPLPLPPPPPLWVSPPPSCSWSRSSLRSEDIRGRGGTCTCAAPSTLRMSLITTSHLSA